MLKNINLQLLAESGAGDPGAGPAQGQPPAAGTPPAGTPPASFTADQMSAIDKIAIDRADRASKSALTDYFQKQGMTEVQASEAIKAYKDAKAKELPASAAEAIAAEKKRADDAVSAASQMLVKAEAKMQAAAIGARPDRIDTVLAMAKLDGSQIKDGVIDTAAVKTALEEVLKQFPEWKATSDQQPGFQVGSSGGSPSAADDAALRRAMGLPVTTK